MKTPEAKQQFGSQVLGQKVSDDADALAGVAKGTKEEIQGELENIIKGYQTIKDDSELWNNGLTDSQRMTIDDVLKAQKALSTIGGTKYKKAVMTLAQAPVLTSIGHPMAATMRGLTGASNIIESLFSNMGEISPKQMETYNDIMSTVPKDSLIYKTFSNIKDLLNNPALQMGGIKGGRVASQVGVNVEQYIQAAEKLMGRKLWTN